MNDEESRYDTEVHSAVDDAPEKKDVGEPLSALDVEVFGNEETAEVKYRTMKWW